MQPRESPYLRYLPTPYPVPPEMLVQFALPMFRSESEAPLDPRWKWVARPGRNKPGRRSVPCVRTRRQ